MVTMKEIANKAGVSVSTVSLVLNGRDEGRVKSKIADNVRAIATKLGYQSNPLASSLRTGRTHILGFISEEVATTPYAGGMILGAQTAASQFGYMLITVSTDGENSESEEIAALKRYGTDGFLYAKMSNRITHVPSSLAKTPLVLVDATDSLGKIPSVEPDEFQIGYDATTRLVKAGCARIAYVGCLEPLIAQDDRLEGYQAALRDAGLDYDDHLVVNVLNNGPALTAVSDLFDAETLEPMLTTVELPHFEMGYWAVAKLVSIIEGRSMDDVSWPATTAPLPPIDAPIPAKIHCTLIEKASVK